MALSEKDRNTIFALLAIVALAAVAYVFCFSNPDGPVEDANPFYSLLMKSAHSPLSAQEKRKVRQQLFDIMKTIPALAIFALPGGGIALPLLIKLLPFNLLPSSFED